MGSKALQLDWYLIPEEQPARPAGPALVQNLQQQQQQQGQADGSAAVVAPEVHMHSGMVAFPPQACQLHSLLPRVVANPHE